MNQANKAAEVLTALSRSKLAEIDELCQQGLNSDKPAHWEAALRDILDVVRRAS